MNPDPILRVNKIMRYSLRTLLTAIVFVAALLASYRAGVERGRQLGPVIPPNLTAYSLYAREYDISDIVKSKSDADLLIASLRTTAQPESWDVQGGSAGIAVKSDARSFTVTHVVGGHVSVVEYLSHVRDAAAGRSGFADVLEEAKSTYNARHKTD